MALTDDQSSNQETPSNKISERRDVVYDEDPSLLVRPEECRGSLPGNVRVRLVRPKNQAFKRTAYGMLEATGAADVPSGGFSRFIYNTKRFLIGAPIATSQSEHERLTKFKALAVLSSDAISSVAYATEACMVSLIAAGSGNLGNVFPIGLAIIALLVIVATSYSQTIPAYPNGGGSYIVAKDNLGTIAGLIAAASLLIDYVLTVSVSISSGVSNLAALFNQIGPYVVTIDVALVILVTVVNLRGVRESGTVFALPTYLFIGSALLMIIVGVFQSFGVLHHPLIARFAYVKATEPLSLFLILKAFAAGCSAMTGVEAISNGVPAFKKPETKNATITLAWMAGVLGVLFLGITVLTTSYGIQPDPTGQSTVISQIASRTFQGPLFFMFPVFQIATLLILTLAANTSYSDFPRLASLLARDNFLPHQFAFRGDRLAFSIGIVFLAVLASILLVAFNGDTTNLINLYAIGVFMSFTLSQSGMVRHWWKLRKEHKGWLRSLIINGLGALTTLLVAGVIASTKFVEGAWIVVVLIPLLVLMFLAIHNHYTHVEETRTTDIPVQPTKVRHRLIVPVNTLDILTKRSVAYARSITEDVKAVHIALNTSQAQQLQAEWEQWQTELAESDRTALEVKIPKTRSLSHELIEYINEVQREFQDDTLTVVLPEEHYSFWRRVFTNPVVLSLKARLFLRPDIVVTNIALHVHKTDVELHAKKIRHRFIVPVAGLDRVSIQSLAYARSISQHTIAAHVAIDPHDAEKVRAAWDELQKRWTKDQETQLVIIESPYRSLSRPLLAYIDTVHELYPEDTLTVILPEFVVKHWWEYPLHNQTAFQLKASLLSRPDIIVTNIPQHLRKNHTPQNHSAQAANHVAG